MKLELEVPDEDLQALRECGWLTLIGVDDARMTAQNRVVVNVLRAAEAVPVDPQLAAMDAGHDALDVARRFIEKMQAYLAAAGAEWNRDTAPLHNRERCWKCDETVDPAIAHIAEGGRYFHATCCTHCAVETASSIQPMPDPYEPLHKP